MLIDVKTACEQLKAHDDILILTHQKPDGDTLGASFALMRALTGMGKKARVWCADGFPARYGFICGGYNQDKSLDAGFIVAVDVASPKLLCADYEKFKNKIGLCIDHHKSNSMYAKYTLLDVNAAAACEIVYDIILAFGVKADKPIADAIFTGISTDTGCFKYSNVTAKTHAIASDMIRLGADHAMINKIMFDTKSRGSLMVDRMIMDTIRFYFDNRCAVTFLPADTGKRFNVTDEELDGISAFPTRIEGVIVGVTIKDGGVGAFRVSVRTVSPVDASKICMIFGGGGHINAAGCTMTGDLDDVRDRLLKAVEEELAVKVQ